MDFPHPLHLFLPFPKTAAPPPSQSFSIPRHCLLFFSAPRLCYLQSRCNFHLHLTTCAPLLFSAETISSLPIPPDRKAGWLYRYPETFSPPCRFLAVGTTMHHTITSDPFYPNFQNCQGFNFFLSEAIFSPPLDPMANALLRGSTAAGAAGYLSDKRFAQLSLQIGFHLGQAPVLQAASACCDTPPIWKLPGCPPSHGSVGVNSLKWLFSCHSRYRIVSGLVPSIDLHPSTTIPS